MFKRTSHGLSPNRLRAYLALLFVALFVPSIVLIQQTRHQLKWEAFHQYRTLADELGLRIDAELQRMIAAEEARGYSDYQFVVLAGDPATSNFVQRSSLSNLPVPSELVGVLGYFQVDSAGTFSSPLLPADLSDPSRWGLDTGQIKQRVTLRDSLFDVLVSHQLLPRESPLQRRVDTRQPQHVEPLTSGPTAPAMTKRDEATPNQAIAAQAAFDALNSPANQIQRTTSNRLGRVDDLRLAQNFQRAAAEQLAQSAAPPYEQQLKANAQAHAKRTEQSAVVEAADRNAQPGGAPNLRQVRIFESEVDPFEFNLLGNTHGVLYRKVWRDGQRTIQGAIIDQKAFLDRAIIKAFRETALAQMSDLAVAYQHDILRYARSTADDSDAAAAGELQGELLHQVRLSAPFGDFQLLWNINRLPTGPGGQLMIWAGIVLLVILVVGFALIYRLGMKQILLSKQQQDFVSAVSHELNTPLTSIRMYAEMLEAGWPSEAKKREYYRFIHSESERLARLISNVLQLARLERNELRIETKPVEVASLIDMIRSRLAQQIERAGFTGEYVLDPASLQRELLVDVDAFIQIVINLVDNALKFSAQSARRVIEMRWRARSEYQLEISVRDYGPGVETAEMQRVFKLFYRAGRELTRAAPGTGIGLALVRQLARAMGGDVTLVNRKPGAEFQLLLPMAVRSSSTAADGDTGTSGLADGALLSSRKCSEIAPAPE
ncbi:MAG: HAMP domain-containing sensor histidine kinase [Tahibacter sp.]